MIILEVAIGLVVGYIIIRNLNEFLGLSAILAIIAVIVGALYISALVVVSIWDMHSAKPFLRDIGKILLIGGAIVGIDQLVTYTLKILKKDKYSVNGQLNSSLPYTAILGFLTALVAFIIGGLTINILKPNRELEGLLICFFTAAGILWTAAGTILFRLNIRCRFFLTSHTPTKNPPLIPTQQDSQKKTE